MAAAGIIRDSNGNWIRGFSKFLGIENSLKTEMWAVALGFKLAKDMFCDKLVVESDSMIVIKLFTVDDVCVSHVGVLIHYCMSILRDIMIVRIQHTLREGNMYADTLAKQTNLLQQPLVVHDTLPSSLKACFYDYSCLACGNYDSVFLDSTGHWFDFSSTWNPCFNAKMIIVNVLLLQPVSVDFSFCLDNGDIIQIGIFSPF
ncbi:putative ribonuclease H-like domain-containing protein [Senna tora]|uniref:Putative ribonuclease H-like domain-containing protein n=1 Tax=Senna tora TaxID=362788 RepID=A0A835CLM2_9FABA|nr:putative ribonuclease H-like domain-containing protein [Senna tora]